MARRQPASKPSWTDVKAELASFDIGYQDDGYFDALVRMFEQALKAIAHLSASDRRALIARLDKVRAVSQDFGYGVGDDMDSLLAKYARE
jgi:hypothetical protein